MRHAERADVLEWAGPRRPRRARTRLAAGQPDLAGHQPALLLERTDRPGDAVWRGRGRCATCGGSAIRGPFAGCPAEFARGPARRLGSGRGGLASGPATRTSRRWNSPNPVDRSTDDRSHPAARRLGAEPAAPWSVAGSATSASAGCPAGGCPSTAQQHRGTHRAAAGDPAADRHRACPTPRSPSGSWSPPGPSTTTSRRCSRSSACTPPRSGRPARLARPSRVGRTPPARTPDEPIADSFAIP